MNKIIHQLHHGEGYLISLMLHQTAIFFIHAKAPYLSRFRLSLAQAFSIQQALLQVPVNNPK